MYLTVFSLSRRLTERGSAENVGSAESAAGNVTGTKTGSAGDLDPGNAGVAPAHGSVKENERDQQAKRAAAATTTTTTPPPPGGGSGRKNVVAQEGETAGVGKGVETGRRGAGAESVRETGTGVRGWTAKRLFREMALTRAESECRRSMKEKEARVWKSVETVTKKGTGTEDAATETGRGAGETGTETGSTREIEGIERKVSAERIATDPYEMTPSPRTTWVMRTREKQRNTWRSTVRKTGF